jgi:hypothetical protein
LCVGLSFTFVGLESLRSLLICTRG